MAKRILGIDPGLATMGFGIIESNGDKHRLIQFGVLTTQAGQPTPQRLRSVFLGVTQLMETYQPDEVAFEELFFSKNITTGIAVAHGRGVILLEAERLGVPVFEYTPMQVKQAVVGYGGADKKQVISMVTRILNLPEPPKPDDTADALAIAICHAHSGCSRMGNYYNQMQ